MPTIIEPLECPVDDVASVPRRFGVGVMLILTTAFAVLFAIMRTCGAKPELFCVVAVLFFAVTLGQILLFQGKKPRAASLLSGAIVFPLEILVLNIYLAASERRQSDDWFGFTVSMVILAAIGGAPLGYLAGGIMAGVFFVQERLGRKNIEPVEIELVPITAADCDTLCAWVHHRQLFALWAQEQFTYPLDSEQLEVRFAAAMPAQPIVAGETELLKKLPELISPEGSERIAYKAVGGPMQEMVAMVELANIDRVRLRANIELAIVDPSRNDRADLSRRLVGAILREAFDRQGLRWLRVVVHRTAVETAACFEKQQFMATAPAVPMPKETSGYTMLVRSNRY